MKSIKAIITLGVVVGILTAATIVVLKIADVVAAEEYVDLLIKSLSIVGVVTLACIVIAFIVGMTSKNRTNL